MPRAADSPADKMLVAAFEAADFERKAHYASIGLSARRLTADTQALLLRQLYLSALGRERYQVAVECAEQMLQQGRLRAVAHADAARAYAALDAVALRDTGAPSGSALRHAVIHQRAATRLAPASLRAVQYGRLARLLRREKHWTQAALAFKHALRWSTWDRSLLQAQLELLKFESGDRVNIATAYEALAQNFVNSPLTYYVAAELASAQAERFVAQRLFREFHVRCEALPLVERISLLAEQHRACSETTDVSRVSIQLRTA